MVKVVFLGASGVGKTAIVEQFVWNTFSAEHQPTEKKRAYCPSVVINDHPYELHITDIPVIPYFPGNSFVEWADFRFYGLRSASAYVLVFDLANADTFQYIRRIREQILESRDLRSVPVLVVGNKQDLLVVGVPAERGADSGSGSNRGVRERERERDRERDRDRDRRRDIVSLVKKHWKCTYVECSAKYNWRIVAVFHELVRSVDTAGRTTARETSSPTSPTGGRCDIL